MIWELTNDRVGDSSIADSLYSSSGNPLRALARFQTTLGEAIQMLGLLNDPASMKKAFGFIMEEYLSLQHDGSAALRMTANPTEKVASDTGITQVGGGSTGILSGLAIIGGILAAPLSAGVSLALTAVGVAGGVASTGTTITAKIVKEEHVRTSASKVKDALESHEPKEQGC